MTERHDDCRASRREFLGRALAALAAGPAVLSAAGTALAGSRPIGTATLDALLLAYFPAPLGPAGTATWQLDTAADYTVRPTAAGATLAAAVPPRDRELFLGTKFRQASSRAERGALVLRHALRRGEDESVTTDEGGGPEAAVFFGLMRPRLRLEGAVHPSGEARLKYWIEGSGPMFLFSLGALRGDQQLRDELGEGTIASWEAVYAYDPAALAGPRFDARGRVAGAQTITLEERGEAAGDVASATTSARVMAFEPADGSTAAPLEAGSALSVRHSSAQRATEKRVARVEAEVADGTAVFYDRVFKTFVFARGE